MEVSWDWRIQWRSHFLQYILVVRTCYRGFPTSQTTTLNWWNPLVWKIWWELLIALSVDANSHIYPFAYVIVPKESAKTWGLFLYNLWYHVVWKRKGICLISDWHKGILLVVRNTRNGWEDVHHEFCLHHAASNFNTNYEDKMLKNLMYCIGLSLE